MDKPQVMEIGMDVLKVGAATAAPGAQILFGATLQEWMYIASIVASVFYILDKLPSIVRRINGWIKRKSNSRNGSSDPVNDDSTG